MAKKTQAPAKRFPHINAKLSGGEWKWRARMRGTDRKIVTGSLRATQEEAYEDSKALLNAAAQAAEEAEKEMTLEQALAQVEKDSLARGVTERWIKALHSHGRYLRTAWDGRMPMSHITVDAVDWLIGWARSEKDEDGTPKRARAANTLLEKDLPLLGRALEAAGLSSAVVESARKRHHNLRKTTPQRAFFEREEIVELVRRMREDDFHGEKGKRLSIPARQHHADIVDFFLRTAIRSGEFARIQVDEVDMVRRKIPVIAKDRSHPREITITDGLLPICERLVEYARKAGRQNLVPSEQHLSVNVFKRWAVRLKEPRLTGRALRHTAITGVLLAGGNPLDAKELAGHKNISTTDTYVHMVSSIQAGASRRLDAWLDAGVAKESDDSPPQSDERAAG